MGVLAPATARAGLPAAAAFHPDQIRILAEGLSQRPFAALDRPKGAAANLDYDAYRRIVFRRDRALWAQAGLPFRAEYFPTAYIYPQPVDLFEVADGEVRSISFSVDDFQVPPELTQACAALPGYSGFRLQNPINDPAKFDEIAVFQGASYFRSLGRDQGYGLSARGVAVGCGTTSEEFPAFTAFWIERPQAGAGFTVVHALLDGPSLTGAYRFVITPGETTVFDVEATLFPRRTVTQPGLAAQSSMFLFGAADRAQGDGLRDAAHDSDGLEIHTSDGRRIWRPLTNPRRLQLSAFEDASPRGFGLAQRARDFAAYGDLEARYDRRPSLWVEPLGDWGPGAVCLLEIPTINETMDNIAAFWRPARPWTSGHPVSLRYRLHWGAAPRGELAQVARTAAGRNSGEFAVDFTGLAAAVPGLRAEVSASAGQAGPAVLAALPQSGAVRATFRFAPPAQGPAELDLRLVGDAGDLSETWRFRWTA